MQYAMPQDPQDHDVAALTNKTSPSCGQIFSSLIVALKLKKSHVMIVVSSINNAVVHDEAPGNQANFG